MPIEQTLQLSLGPVLFYWTRERYAADRKSVV